MHKLIFYETFKFFVKMNLKKISFQYTDLESQIQTRSEFLYCKYLLRINKLEFTSKVKSGSPNVNFLIKNWKHRFLAILTKIDFLKKLWPKNWTSPLTVIFQEIFSPFTEIV